MICQFADFYLQVSLSSGSPVHCTGGCYQQSYKEGNFQFLSWVLSFSIEVAALHCRILGLRLIKSVVLNVGNPLSLLLSQQQLFVGNPSFLEFKSSQIGFLRVVGDLRKKENFIYIKFKKVIVCLFKIKFKKY